MNPTVKPLDELINELPPDLRAEVRDLVGFLLTQHARPRPGKLRQDWAGALEAYRSVSH